MFSKQKISPRIGHKDFGNAWKELQYTIYWNILNLHGELQKFVEVLFSKNVLFGRTECRLNDNNRHCYTGLEKICFNYFKMFALLQKSISAETKSTTSKEQKMCRFRKFRLIIIISEIHKIRSIFYSSNLNQEHE